MSAIVVLGGSGYIGSRLCRALAKTYALRIFKGDIRDRRAVERSIKKGNIVLNLAGTTTVPQEERNHFDVNVAGQQVVADVCAKVDARVVYFSTVHVYAGGKGASRESDAVRPLDAYSLSKKLGEEVYEFYARERGLPATVLRLGSVYGPGHKKGVVAVMMQSLRTRGVIEVPKQRVVRDLIHIDDVIAAIQRVIRYRKKGFHLFNITSGKSVELAALAKLIARAAGRGIVVRVDKKSHPAVINASVVRARKELGFAPRVALKDGLQSTITSYTI